MLTRRARVRSQRTGPAGRRSVQQPYHAAKSLSPLPKGLKMLEFDTLSKDNIDTRTRVVELSGGRFAVVELESFLWNCIEEVCLEGNLPVGDLCSLVETIFPDMPLRSALSSYVVEYFRQAWVD